MGSPSVPVSREVGVLLAAQRGGLPPRHRSGSGRCHGPGSGVIAGTRSSSAWKKSNSVITSGILIWRLAVSLYCCAAPDRPIRWQHAGAAHRRRAERLLRGRIARGGREGARGGARDQRAAVRCRHGWLRVVATKDYHVDPGTHFAAHPDYVDSWPRHCVAGTGGADFHPRSTPTRSGRCSKGRTGAAYSGFEGENDGVRLAEWLRARGSTGGHRRHRHRLLRAGRRPPTPMREGFTTRVLVDLTVKRRPSPPRRPSTRCAGAVWNSCAPSDERDAPSSARGGGPIAAGDGRP